MSLALSNPQRSRSARPALLGTTAVAVLLVVAAVCDTLEPFIQPLSGSSTADDLAVIAAHQDAFVVSKLVGMVGTLLFLPGLLGLLQRTAPLAPTASRITAFFVVVGFPSFMGIRLGSAVELQTLRDGMSRHDGGALIDHLESNPLAVPIVAMFLLGTLVGMIALGVTLWRSGFPKPAAVLLAVFPVADMGLEGVAPEWCAHVVLLVGVVWVAAHLLGQRDASSSSASR